MDQQSQMLQSFFFLYVQVKVYQNILEVRYWLLTFTLYKAFLKNKKKLELVSLPHFNHDFWKEVFITLYFINWPNFIAWLPSFLEILGNRCIIIICSPICDVMNFEITIKLSFYITRKSGEIFISQEREKLLTWNKNHFSSFLKGCQLSEVASDPRVDLLKAIPVEHLWYYYENYSKKHKSNQSLCEEKETYLQANIKVNKNWDNMSRIPQWREKGALLQNNGSSQKQEINPKERDCQYHSWEFE